MTETTMGAMGEAAPKRRHRKKIQPEPYHNIEPHAPDLAEASTRDAIRRDNMSTLRDNSRFQRPAGLSDFERRTWGGKKIHPIDIRDEKGIFGF